MAKAPGTIAFIGSNLDIRNLLGSNTTGSEIVVINPHNPDPEQISGREFTGVLIGPYAKESRYFNEIYQRVLSRIRIKQNGE